MIRRTGRAFEMRRGDSYIIPHDRRRIAVGLRWAAALEDGSPLDFDVAGSCTLLDARGNLITTLSAQHTVDDRAGGTAAIRFVPDPIFDFPARLFMLVFYVFAQCSSRCSALPSQESALRTITVLFGWVAMTAPLCWT